MTDSDALVTPEPTLVTVQLGEVGGAVALPQGGQGIVGVWVPAEGAWRMAFIHQNGEVTTHTGRPGAGPHRVFRDLANKAEWALEATLNLATAKALELSVDASKALQYEQKRNLDTYGAPAHLGEPPR